MGNVRDLRTINNSKKKQSPPEEPEPEAKEEEYKEEEPEEKESSHYSNHSYDDDSGFSITSIVTTIMIVGVLGVLVFTAFNVVSNTDLQNIFPTAEPTPTIKNVRVFRLIPEHGH